jgi:NAD(P)-dependent dehydrogenase (short-subunit alcohol dehydrogenase family)
MFQALGSSNIANKRVKMSSVAATTTSSTGPVLVTGGCGYIGSHTIVCLLEQGYNVVVVDNLVNSSKESLDRVAEIANLDEQARKERLIFHQVDLCDKEALKAIFESSSKFSSCIHFAGLKVQLYGSNLVGSKRFPWVSRLLTNVISCPLFL